MINFLTMGHTNILDKQINEQTKSYQGMEDGQWDERVESHDPRRFIEFHRHRALEYYIIIQYY